MKKTDEEWREKLTPEQFEVCRKKGTERAYSGKYWNSFDKGFYKCVCCGEKLFISQTKFESGCGWPSFFRPAGDDVVDEHIDTTHGMMRTEVTCKKCGSHLGHVFDDGPGPTGLRYCINSLSIDLEKDVDEDT